MTPDEFRALDVAGQVAACRKALAEQEAVEWFCKRVEIGEVRSVHTYARFRALLAAPACETKCGKCGDNRSWCGHPTCKDPHRFIQHPGYCTSALMCPNHQPCPDCKAGA